MGDGIPRRRRRGDKQTTGGGTGEPDRIRFRVGQRLSAITLDGSACHETDPDRSTVGLLSTGIAAAPTTALLQRYAKVFGGRKRVHQEHSCIDGSLQEHYRLQPVVLLVLTNDS